MLKLIITIFFIITTLFIFASLKLASDCEKQER